MAISNNDINKVVQQVFAAIDKQSGVKKPWRQTRFNDLYYPPKDMLNAKYFVFTFKSWFWKLSFGDESEGEVRTMTTWSREDAYIRMFHCMLYLFSALMHPCNAWLVCTNPDDSDNTTNKNNTDETKKMQTFIRQYISNLDESELDKFVTPYIFNHGPFYDESAQKRVLKPCPPFDDVRVVLRNIIESDTAPEQPKPDSHYIISQSQIDFQTNQADSMVIDIQANVPWKIVGGDSNCYVYPTEDYGDSNIKISVTENDEEEDRSWEFTIRDNTQDGSEPLANDFRFTVKQAKKIVIHPKLEVKLNGSDTQITMDSEGGTYKLVVLSNVEWQITWKEKTQSQDWPRWINSISPSVGVRNSYVYIEFSPNIDTVDRTATFIFQCDGVVPIEVGVFQEKSSEPRDKLSISPEEITVPGLNSHGYIIITTEEAWEIDRYSGKIDIAKADRKGTGNKTVWYDVDPNKSGNWRDLKIRVDLKNGSAQKTQLIHQEPSGDVKNLSIEPEIQTIGAEGGTVEFNIYSNTTWQVGYWWSYAYIESVVPHSGEGNGTVQIKVIPNTTEDVRDILFYVLGSSAQDVSGLIKQDGAILYPVSISPDSIDVPARGGEYQIEVTTDRSSTIWIANDSALIGKGTLSQTIGMGYAIVNLEVFANSDEGARTMTVTFQEDGGSSERQRTLTINQAGRMTLSVNPTSLSMGAEAEAKYLNITSNTSWEVVSDKEWCTINPASGNGNGRITVTVEANPEDISRNAVVTVSGEGVIPVNVDVQQNAGS